MTEEELQSVLDEHPEVTVTDARGVAYLACPTCPQIPGVGLARYPCVARQLTQEIRRLGGWVTFLEERLEYNGETWTKEMRP